MDESKTVQCYTLRQVISELAQSNAWENPIVTEVTPLDVFYPAEEYHQQYYRRNLNAPYCRIIIAPKIGKLREQFADKLKPEAAEPM